MSIIWFYFLEISIHYNYETISLTKEIKIKNRFYSEHGRAHISEENKNRANNSFWCPYCKMETANGQLRLHQNLYI